MKKITEYNREINNFPQMSYDTDSASMKLKAHRKTTVLTGAMKLVHRTF